MLFMSISTRVACIANVLILFAVGYLPSIANADRVQQKLLHLHGSNVVRSTAKGPCGKGFHLPDPKWRRYGVFDILESEEFEDVLFGWPSHRDFEPTRREDCMQSANIGVHAFLAGSLAEALKKAPANTAVVDIGSGTGFLLNAFRHYVKEGVEVIGVELEQGAAEHSRRVLPDVEVFEEDAFKFSYKKQFSVMNVGFASESLPEHLIGLMADGGTIIMPICTKATDGALDLKQLPMGQNCAARFHIFEATRAATGSTAADLGEIGAPMRFFYVPIPSQLAADPIPSQLSWTPGSWTPSAREVVTQMGEKKEGSKEFAAAKKTDSMKPMALEAVEQGYSGKQVKHADGKPGTKDGQNGYGPAANPEEAPAKKSAGVRGVVSAAVVAMLAARALF